MKISQYVLVGANVFFWGGFAWVSWGLMKAVEVQHVVGHPSLGQIQFYLIVPLVMVTVATVPPMVLWRTKWPWLGTVWAVCALIPIFPYACVSGGGV
jgi:hypothetical protein